MRLAFGEFTLDTDREELRLRGRPVHVGPVGFPLLLYLVRNRHRLVTRQELHEEVWGGRDLAPSTIPTAISVVRQSLADDPKSPKFIRSKYGRGYRFVAEVIEHAGQFETVRPALLHLFETDESLEFVGRAEELRKLRRSAATRAGLVSVIGSAGVGKSRLIERFAAERARAGDSILIARCTEFGGAAPYGPMLDLVRQLDGIPGASLASSDADAYRTLRDFETEAWAQRDGIGSSASLGVDGRYRLLSAFAAAFRAGKNGPPILAVVDDFHRVDPASAQAMRFVLSSAPNVTGILAYRDAELSDAVSTELASMLRELSGLTVEVDALSSGDSRKLVESRLAIDIPDALADRIFELTAGNPFFLTTVSDLLKRSGAAGAGSVEDEGRLPQATRDAVIQHVAGLSEDARAILTQASILGREFSRRLLRLVSDLPPGRFESAVDEACDAGVLSLKKPARFSHVLLRDALYEAAGGELGAALHAKAFEGLGQLYGELPGSLLASRAQHAISARSFLDPSARIDACRQAAEWARARFAFSDAAGWYAEALDSISEFQSTDESQRCELLIGLAECLHRSNRREEGQESARRGFLTAKRIDDIELMARAALAYSPGFFAIEVGVVDQFLVAALEEVRSRLSESSPPALSVEVAARLAMALYWTEDRSHRQELADSAVEAAQSVGGSVVAYALTAREVALWDSSQPKDKEVVARAALRMAIAAGEHEMELVYRVYRISSLLQLARFEAVDLELDAFRSKARLVGHSNALWFVDLFEAMKAMIAGDRESAVKATSRFVQKGGAVGDLNADHCRVVHRVYQRMEFGPIGDAADIAQDQWERYQRVGAYRCSLPFLYWESQEELAARVSFEALAREGLATIPRNVEWLIGMAMLAEGCAAIGDRRRALELYELLMPHRQECVVVGFGVAVFRPVAYFLGRLATTMGRFRDGEHHFSIALGIAEQAKSRPWRAHAEYGLCELLVRRNRRGDLERASRLVESCLAGTSALGMRPLEDRAKRLRDLLIPHA